MPKKNTTPAVHPNTLRASAQAASDEHVVAVADIPKTVFEISYTIQQRGHNPEVRDVVVASEKMSDAVVYIEEQGGIVQSCRAVMNGAQFINL